VVDRLLLALACYLAYYLRYNLLLSNGLIEALRINTGGSSKDHAQVLASFFPLFSGGDRWQHPALFPAWRLYSALNGNFLLQVRQVVTSLTFGLSLLIAYYFVFQSSLYSRLLVPFIWVCAIITLCLGRVLLSIVLGQLYRLAWGSAACWWLARAAWAR